MKFFDLSSYYESLELEKIKKFFPDVEKRIKALSKIQNHVYKNKKIAALALMHRSALVYWPHKSRDSLSKNHETIFSNEKLEYLGDSFLNFFVAGYSMSLLPTLTEGELSKLRAVIVGSENLAAKSRDLNLGTCLMFGKTEQSVSYSNQDNILADAFEAATASLLLDSGYTKTIEWLSTIFREDILFHSENLTNLDAKGALQNWVQQKYGMVPIYRAVDITTDKRLPLFEVSLIIDEREIAHASAKTKKEASKKVAQDVLKKIENGEII